MARILITNDDGVRSPGIGALAEALDGLGEVYVLAPTREASAIGHALTLHHPVRLEHLKDRVYAVDGTPTDCVNIAVAAVLHGLPDLVVSGINKGLNVGDDVTYSGTVSGALEASLLGVRAIAVSLQEAAGEWHWDHAARVARRVAEAVLRDGLPPRTFLNVNVPRGEPKGVRVTVQGKRNHATTVSERHDPRGRPYYWIGEGQDEWLPNGESDYEAIRAGFVSVTPLQPDLTAHASLEAIRQLAGSAQLTADS
ncbi:MAG TPA: 5'/3'-nucleotidase SurE [Vicinamibacterales bacterium]|nr:5'/3'-nucleotidase SurE [Acidobacteriota bacterium]HOC18825.1 5'/3'-nucleotidase SurE [Vicinamibacterales bacterium]